jgi:hypothetical protein
VGGDGLFPTVVDVEARVFPGEEVGEFGGADEFGVAEGVEEAVAEECDGGTEVFDGHTVEAAVGGDEDPLQGGEGWRKFVAGLGGEFDFFDGEGSESKLNVE